jgi:hypothetical protein
VLQEQTDCGVEGGSRHRHNVEAMSGIISKTRQRFLQRSVRGLSFSHLADERRMELDACNLRHRERDYQIGSEGFNNVAALLFVIRFDERACVEEVGGPSSATFVSFCGNCGSEAAFDGGGQPAYTAVPFDAVAWLPIRSRSFLQLPHERADDLQDGVPLRRWHVAQCIHDCLLG